MRGCGNARLRFSGCADLHGRKCQVDVDRHRADRVAAGAHQGWSANLFTTTSDMFPRSAVARCRDRRHGGSVGSALFAFFAATFCN